MMKTVFGILRNQGDLLTLPAVTSILSKEEQSQTVPFTLFLIMGLLSKTVVKLILLDGKCTS